jgi:hypothetical protein
MFRACDPFEAIRRTEIAATEFHDWHYSDAICEMRKVCFPAVNIIVALANDFDSAFVSLPKPDQTPVVAQVGSPIAGRAEHRRWRVLDCNPISKSPFEHIRFISQPNSILRECHNRQIDTHNDSVSHKLEYVCPPHTFEHYWPDLIECHQRFGNGPIGNLKIGRR